jgi:predicted Zn-dependent peptidase
LPIGKTARFTSSPGSAAQGRIRRSVLGNGLRVVSIALPHLHSTLVSVFVRCGSRHETRRTNGISHLLEHLLLRGSERFPQPQVVATAIEYAGGQLSAATARDHTVFQTAVHPSRLEIPFEVLGDMLRAPLFADLDLEREVIREELASELDRQGNPLNLEDRAMQELFGDHPLGWPVGGTLETLAALREEDVREHHARAYGASNLLVICAGPTPHEQVERLSQKFFGALPAGEALVDGPPAAQRTGPPLVRLLKRPGGQTELRFAFLCSPRPEVSFSHLRVLRRNLGQGPAARLQLGLVEQRALAYAVGASLEGYSDCAVFSVAAVCTPEKALPLAAQLLRILSELRTTEVPEADMGRLRAGARIRGDFMLDSPIAIVEWLALGELWRDPSSGMEPWLRELEAVTASDLRRAADFLFRRSGMTACVAGPLGSEEPTLRKLLLEAQGLER